MSVSQATNITEAMNEKACHWVVAFDAGGVSPEDHARFMRWVNQSLTHREAFEDIRSTWQKCDVVQRLRPDEADSDVVARRERRRNIRRRIAPLAAAATVAAIAFGFWVLQGPMLHEAEYFTSVGEQQTIILPDESLITLNTDSRVEVHYTGDERRVELRQGEAHFEVARATNRPFIVVAGTGTLRAVGTAFTVYVRDDAVDVTVTEGTVELLASIKPTNEILSAAAPNESQSFTQTLTERQKLRYKTDVVEAVATVTENEIERELAWRDGMLDFQDTPLSEVIAEAGRYTRDELIIVDSELESIEFTGYFRAGDVTLLMRLLESNDFVAAKRVDGNTVHITRVGTLPH